jgi:hypothetical protein
MATALDAGAEAIQVCRPQILHSVRWVAWGAHPANGGGVGALGAMPGG